MWGEFIKMIPDGYLKAILYLIPQAFLSVVICLTNNTIATILVALADLLIRNYPQKGLTI